LAEQQDPQNADSENEDFRTPGTSSPVDPDIVSREIIDSGRAIELLDGRRKVERMSLAQLRQSEHELAEIKSLQTLF